METKETTIQEAATKLSEALNEFGKVIKKTVNEIAQKIQILTGPIIATILMESDDKLQLWYKQYETARGRKRARLKKKIKRREQRYITKYMN